MQRSQSPDPYKALEKSFRAAYLIAGFLQRTLTIAEEEELDQWIQADEKNEVLFARITGESDWPVYLNWYQSKNTAEKLKETRQRLGLSDAESSGQKRFPSFMRYAAALVLLVGVGSLYVLLTRKPAASLHKPVVEQPDILPGAAFAQLKDAEGHIYLLRSGLDTNFQEGFQVSNNQLNYSGSNATGWHELIVPRKAFYKLQLPDGTSVWLNAGSSLRYPGSFTGAAREVELSGEAYFEVAKDQQHPFIVKSGELRIEVLGTAFNVQAYPDETVAYTALVHGSIKASNAGHQTVLVPSTQLLSSANQWEINSTPDINSIIAWKNNEFRLRNHSIRSIMKLLERWYDCTVIYKDEVNYHFNGSISRDVPLSEVLHLLEATGQVHFTIHENQVTVMK